MASPMRWPSGLTATNCLALPGPKFAKVLTARPLSSRSASGPSTNRSVMWCDWSSSAQVSSQDRDSVRQLVNSGCTGKVLGGKARFRRSSTGLPARASAAARLSDDMSGTFRARGKDRGPGGGEFPPPGPGDSGGRLAPPSPVVVAASGLGVRRRAHHGAHGELLVRLDGGLLAAAVRLAPEHPHLGAERHIRVDGGQGQALALVGAVAGEQRR